MSALVFFTGFFFGLAIGIVIGVALAVREHRHEEDEAYRRAVRLSRQRQYGERW